MQHRFDFKNLSLSLFSNIHSTHAATTSQWSEPITLIENYGRLAIGNQLHVIGQSGGKLIHKSSADEGKTWSVETVLDNTTNFFPMMYGGVYCQGDTVYLLTAAGNMEYAPRQLDFWRSNDNGKTWSKPIRITNDSTNIYRARIVASGTYGGGQTIASDNNLTWSQGIIVGKDTKSSNRQARGQIAAADGNVFLCWQREGGPSGKPILPQRLGYNFSSDGGLTWGVAKILEQDSGVDRNHQEVWMTSGGDVHLCWRHGFSNDDPLGYIHSGDYGKTWDKSEIAFGTPGGNHPFSICANKNRVHVLTAPQGEMKYASRLLKPVVTRIEKPKANLILKSTKSVPFYKLFGKYLLGVLP